jgi:hypothetical protein
MNDRWGKIDAELGALLVGNLDLEEVGKCVLLVCKKDLFF